MKRSADETQYRGMRRAFEPWPPTEREHEENARPLPADLIDSRLMDPGNCFDTYRDGERDFYDVFATSRLPEEMKMYVRATGVADLGFSEFRATTHGVRRTATHVRRTPIEALRVRLYRSGITRALFDDTPVTMKAGAIHVVDYSRPSEAISEDVDQISLFVPHWLIGYDPGRHPPHWQIGVETPIGRVLECAMTTFHAQLPCMTVADAPAAAEALRGMLAGAFRQGLDSLADKSIQDARARAMRRHLDANLTDPDLDIASLMQAFGASRATIFRDFAEEGGVERYIMRRRLDRAYAALSGSEPRRGLVRETADFYHFSSPSHLSRLFLERFGCRPGEIVGIGMGARPE